MLIMNNITKSLEKGKFVIGVFLDFDSVDHDILLLKPEHYGIRGGALE